uniref:Curved DNA-binding protein n=1 Tax=Candidatus Kentrum eta TaxID=2126337 RepID=A0A450VBB3_9GAMM|nr:MAG: curved DNA-binding protein [Candidatus Kentron sp. H]VFK02330.1 MAG: curved DNA-binding protein [Candidatus Kentron sp. H]VFK05357.1 MAG: curved DNA-binding protein [Candidatus Kentron sp. H]
MKYKDYYQLLGVSRTATPDEIKRAYRRLARKYHPDVSQEPNAEACFKEVQEAYEVLKDPEKRKAYNQLGSDWKTGQDFRPPPGWEARFDFGGTPFGHNGFGTGGGFSDFFESLFGGGFQHGSRGFHSRGGPTRPGPQREQDERAKIHITLEEAYRGVERALQLQGQAASSHAKTPSSGTNLKVKIPPGVTRGQRIRLAGQGKAGTVRGPRGDLYLEVEFLPHALFRPEGKDIHLELPITPWEAALGATIGVPTLGGRVDVKIPLGSQSGRKLRLKNRGLGKAHAGDQYIVLKIVTPAADSETARAFYERMAREMPFHPRAYMEK